MGAHNFKFQLGGHNLQLAALSFMVASQVHDHRLSAKSVSDSMPVAQDSIVLFPGLWTKSKFQEKEAEDLRVYRSAPFQQDARGQVPPPSYLSGLHSSGTVQLRIHSRERIGH